MQRWIEGLKGWAQRLEKELVALYYAYRDPRTPWFAKIFCGFVIAYAISPIDLIPDFIPVIGYLDDMLIVPFGIWLALKMIPSQVMADSRAKALAIPPQILADKRKSVMLIVSIWVVLILVIALVIYLITRRK
jgi:uncharacterized membrane protein YkvA (DUF1232 family)